MRVGGLEFSVEKVQKEHIPEGKPRAYSEEELKALRQKVISRSISAEHREARGLINLAFLMGEQDVEYKDGGLARHISEIVERYATDEASGSLAKLKAVGQVEEEIENLLIQPFLKMVIKASSTPFRFDARPRSPSEEDRMKAQVAERFIKMIRREDSVDFSRARAQGMVNMAIDGNHFLWPIFNKNAGPRRIVYKTTPFETPFPLVDEYGRAIQDGDTALYAQADKKGSAPTEISYIREGELQLHSIPLRNVLVSGGYTYLSECPDVIVRMPIRKEDLRSFEDTSSTPIKKILEKIEGFYPNRLSYREAVLQRLYQKVEIPVGDAQDQDGGDDKFVMLYHLLEKPTERYPTGRWLTFVFGGKQNETTGKIFLLQEFPLPDEGLSGIPIIENSGPKISGRFQGLTLLEFSIPAQVRHNKLLTARMDKYKRAGEAYLLMDENFTPTIERIPNIGGIWRYKSTARGEKPTWLAPPALPAELFREDISPQLYIEKLWGIPDLKYPQRSDRTATELALLSQQGAQWIRDYGTLGQARAFSKIAFWFVWLFKNYATYGKYGQILNQFNQWERELFLQSDIDCTDITVDEKSLIKEDKMLQQQKLQLAVQINPEYFKTPEGKKVAARVLELEEIVEGSKESHEKSNAVAENGMLYYKLRHNQPLRLDKKPVPDEDNISHLVEHLKIISAPIISNLSEDARMRYIKAILKHCLTVHIKRLEKIQGLSGKPNPIYEEYVTRVKVAAEEVGIKLEEKEEPIPERSELGMTGAPAGGGLPTDRRVQVNPQDLLEQAQGGQGAEPTLRPAQMLMAQLAASKKPTQPAGPSSAKTS